MGVSESILEEASAFAASELAAQAASVEDTGVSRSTIERLAKRGFLAASFPRRFGGLELDPVAYGKLTEILGKACPCTRAVLTLQTSIVGECLLKWGTPEQIECWIPVMARGEKMTAFGLTEPNVGTDARNLESTYKRVGDRWVISGKKKWISFGAIADMFLTIAKSGDEVTAFLVERETHGVSVKPMRGLMGMRGCHLAEVTYQDVAVLDANVLGGVGNGFRYVANTALDHGRYSIAWGGIGIAQAALEAMVSYARKRSQFGKKLHEMQLVQGLIGDAVTKIHAARALCLRAGELRREGSPDGIIETAMAKYFSSVTAGEVTRDAIQVHGGNGCSSLYPVERLFREAKVLEIIEGTSQIQQQIASKYAVQAYFQKEYAVDRDWDSEPGQAG